MKAKRRAELVVLLAALGTIVAIRLPASAYQYPLSSTDARDAYMLGIQKDSRTADFFAQYKHQFPMPESGPHVATIGIETPYGQVVELGETALNTDIPGAAEDFAGKKFPFLVRVGVDLTDTYPGPPPWNPTAPGLPLPDCQRDFAIQLVQDGKKIDADSTQVYLLYSDAVANTYQISGAVIELRFDPDTVDPYDDITIKVHTPDDQNVETSFDLGHLR